MENIVSLEDIVVTFDGEQILNHINLDIRDKEFVTLLGPSGCGKTTTLRIIGGFLEPDSGTVTFEGKKINHIPPYKRNVNTVFQRYALFPHLNVYENIAFGLRVKKMPEREIRSRVGEMLELVNLRGYEKRNISRLSGGQQQRVAIARALVNQPKVLLLDEHTAALDPKTAAKVLAATDKIIERDHLTAIMITHNMKDAIAHGNRLIMMHEGRIIYDVQGEEKKNLHVSDLLNKFEQVSGGEFANDRMMLT